jgi:hypothetical protein
MQSRSGHLGHVLPRDWEIDLDTRLDLAPGLPSQPQDRVGNSTLDFLSRHFANRV